MESLKPSKCMALCNSSHMVKHKEVWMDTCLLRQSIDQPKEKNNSKGGISKTGEARDTDHWAGHGIQVKLPVVAANVG